MPNEKSKKGKPSGKKSNSKGRSGSSGISGRSITTGDSKGSKSKRVQLDTPQVRSNNKSGNKVSTGTDKRVKKVVGRKPRKEIDELQELQELFLQQLQAREKKNKRSIPKTRKTSDDRQTEAERGYSKQLAVAKRSARITTSKGKKDTNLIKVKFHTRNMQTLILALNAYPFNEIDRILRKGIPNKCYVILGCKKPGQPGLFYRTFTSPVDYSLSSKESIKKFVVQTVSEYNNDMADMIDEKYDDPIEVYKIREIGIRLTFPLEIIKREK